MNDVKCKRCNLIFSIKDNSCCPYCKNEGFSVLVYIRLRKENVFMNNLNHFKRLFCLYY